MKQNIEKQSSQEPRRKRHKSDIFTTFRSEARLLKPKRLSCMRATEFLQIEESQGEVANFLIEQILAKVFNVLAQAKTISQVCTQQISNKVTLLDSYQMYTMTSLPEDMQIEISLEEEPKIQPNCKVIPRKQKTEQSSLPKDMPEFNKTNSSNSKTKSRFQKKQKLYKLSTNLGHSNSIKSTHSIYSNKSNANNGFSIAYRYPKRIQQEIENQKEKDKRLREQVIRKLMREHQVKLKENPHPCPEPLLYEYRAFFTQPQTKQQENLRISYLQLREMRIAQEKANNRKGSKKMSSLMASGQSSQRSDANSVNLPKITKSAFSTKKQQAVVLFAQDDYGKVIKVKNNPKIQSREHSNTTYETYIKPRETALKEVSNIYKANTEYLRNDKIKDETSFINDNASLVSTLCHSMTVDQEALEKSILQSFIEKKGIKMKKSMVEQRSNKSIEGSGVKLPSIKKRM